MIRTFLSTLLVCTILQSAYGRSPNSQTDHWNFMNDLMTQHLNKYQNLFRPQGELMFDEDGEDLEDPSRRQKMPLHSFMNQFTDLASIVLNTESHQRKQREKYRKYTAESLPEDGPKSTDELIEGQRLSAIEQEISENRNAVHLDQNTAQQLHNRFLKKYEDNYLGHFRPVEHKIPREEFEDAHIRRLLQDAAETTLVEEEPSAEIDSEGQQNVSDGHENPHHDTQDHPPAEDHHQDQDPQDHPVVKEGHEADQAPVKDKEVDTQKDPEVLAADDPKVEEDAAPKVKNETKEDEQQEEPVVTPEEPKEYPPNMDPNVQPKVDIFYVEETYPVKDDPRLGCKNDAKYVEITQLYYFCFLNSAPNNVIRVNNQSYIYLTTLPYYTKRATCYMAEKTHDACYCSAGYTGALCQYQDSTKCYVNITSPKLYEGCQDEYEDSEFYMYSIQGFDPCHFFDFNKKTDIKFMMKCLPLTKKGIVKENGHTEKLGLEYADVIKQTLPSEKFTYAAVNPETKMKVGKDDSVMFSFDFRDWKYLTNLKKFQLNVTDAGVIAGLKEGTVTVDFKELVDSDEKSGSKFEVAGRVYWEASISGSGYQSFVTTGFFDREGYEEPQLNVGKINYMLEVVLPVSIGILIVVSFIIYKIVQRNKKISEENEQLALMIERQKKQSGKKNKNKK